MVAFSLDALWSLYSAPAEVQELNRSTEEDRVAANLKIKMVNPEKIRFSYVNMC